MRGPSHAVLTRERTVAVLDLGTRKLGCAIARLLPPPKWLAQRQENADIRVLGFAQHVSRGIVAGQISDMDAAEEAIRLVVAKAEHLAGITVDEVHVVMAGGGLSSEGFTASVPIAQREVDDLDLRRAMLAARQYAGRHGQSILRVAVTGYGLDDIPAVDDPRGMIGDTLKVHVVASAADPVALKNMALCIERCHLMLAGVIPAPLASALATMSVEERMLGGLCIDMGAGTASLAAFFDGELVHIDSLPYGGDGITRDLARDLSTPHSEAERLKTLYATVFSGPMDDMESVVCPLVGDDAQERYIYPTKADISAIVRERLERMFLTLRDRLENAGIEPAVCERVVLAGGGSQLAGCDTLAAQIFGGEARLGRPGGMSGLPPHPDPAISAAEGALRHLLITAPDEAPIIESVYPVSEPPVYGNRVHAGYLARVGQWLRENF
jgi:cell division protein FtsA